MLSDDMLGLMAVRYGASSGHVTLENFITLSLRLDCMHSEWTQMTSVTRDASGVTVYRHVVFDRNLQKNVWRETHESSWTRGKKKNFIYEQLKMIWGFSIEARRISVSKVCLNVSWMYFTAHFKLFQGKRTFSIWWQHFCHSFVDACLFVSSGFTSQCTLNATRRRTAALVLTVCWRHRFFLVERAGSSKCRNPEIGSKQCCKHHIISFVC